MRMVYIGECGLGNAVYCVEEPTASKMLEVYDKEQKFEPIQIDSSLIVEVTKGSRWLVTLLIGEAYKILSLEESRKMRAALEAAEKYVENHR